MTQADHDAAITALAVISFCICGAACIIAFLCGYNRGLRDGHWQSIVNHTKKHKTEDDEDADWWKPDNWQPHEE